MVRKRTQITDSILRVAEQFLETNDTVRPIDIYYSFGQVTRYQSRETRTKPLLPEIPRVLQRYGFVCVEPKTHPRGISKYKKKVS